MRQTKRKQSEGEMEGKKGNRKREAQREREKEEGGFINIMTIKMREKYKTKKKMARRKNKVEYKGRRRRRRKMNNQSCQLTKKGGNENSVKYFLESRNTPLTNIVSVFVLMLGERINTSHQIRITNTKKEKLKQRNHLNTS